MDPQNAGIIWNIICALIAAGSTIIAYFIRKSYDDLAKKQDSTDGEVQLLVERMHQLALAQARGESLSVSISEIKSDLKDLRNDVHFLKMNMGVGRKSLHD